MRQQQRTLGPAARGNWIALLVLQARRGEIYICSCLRGLRQLFSREGPGAGPLCRGGETSMDWAKNGVKIVHAEELDMDTPQTSGMTRAAAITHARTGASKL